MKLKAHSLSSLLKLSLPLIALGLLGGCSHEDDHADAAAAESGAKAPALPVDVMLVKTEPVTLYRELPGRTSAYRVAQVRARVDGIVEERLFEEGSDVAAGDVLFKIDPAPYQAQLDSAKAALARARAGYQAAKLQAERFEKLVQTNAISQQDYDDAVAAEQTLKAEIAAARAALDAATIDLGYTEVTAPISGRIGPAEVTEGAYVQKATATLLATIQQIDPLYIDLRESAEEVLRLKAALESGKLRRTDDGGSAAVDVILDNGRTLPQTGSLQFSDVTVNTSTGTVTLRAIVPNPDNNLLPGMFVRARIAEGTDDTAILVPHSLVRRNSQGKPYLLLANAENMIEQRVIETTRSVGNAWLVTGGLKPGERIVTNHQQVIRPGMPVQVQNAE